MPIYEYQCESCGAAVEVLQKFSDPPLTKCSKCGGKLVKKLSPPSFQFKGSGWYVTDYGHSSSSGNGRETPKPAKKKETAASSKPAGDTAKSSSATTKSD